MQSKKRRIGLQLFAVCLCSTLGAWHLATTHGATTILDSNEMRELARGGVPVPCDVNVYQGTCADRLGTCAKQQQGCTGTCTACSQAATSDEYCNLANRLIKPWNAENCANNPDTPGGCGVYYKDVQKCQTVNFVCTCVPQNPQSMTACDQRSAKYDQNCKAN